MTTTVTGLFDSYDSAAATVADLEASGFSRAAVSIVANGNAVTAGSGDGDDVGVDAPTGAETGAAVGAFLGGGAGLLAGLGILAIPGLGPVVAAGWLASAAVGAVTAGAAGGIVGALTGSGVSEAEAHVYAEGVRRGGTLVVAKVDDAKAQVAWLVFERHHAVDAGERRAADKRQGWAQSGADAPPYDTMDGLRGGDPATHPSI